MLSPVPTNAPIPNPHISPVLLVEESSGVWRLVIERSYGSQRLQFFKVYSSSVDNLPPEKGFTHEA